jgi:uncharacterized protein YajQ (UPF0234 family)
LAEGTGTSAIDTELRGIDADATECKETISAIDGAIAKVKSQVAEENVRLRAEKLAELDKQIAASIVSLLRDALKSKRQFQNLSMLATSVFITRFYA